MPHPTLAIDRRHGQVLVRVVHRVASGAIADFGLSSHPP
jgi:hypothetical protein